MTPMQNGRWISRANKHISKRRFVSNHQPLTQHLRHPKPLRETQAIFDLVEANLLLTEIDFGIGMEIKFNF